MLARWCPQQSSVADRMDERHRHLLSQEGHLGVHSCSVSPALRTFLPLFCPRCFQLLVLKPSPHGPALQESEVCSPALPLETVLHRRPRHG